MNSVKRALDKGMDKATNPKDEPQVPNKSSSSSQSQSHALNINPNLTDRHPSLTGSGGGGFDQQHHHVVGEMPQPGSGQRSVGSTGAGINTSGMKAPTATGAGL
ncbi:uncharacterized protein B0T23DRAFT_453156 [Neurospora hispaniola]|uniref:Uncharacterized protein n=1 Tax=Neurospora hispaniola TaxID=588809 RepID=A0AAJ0MTF3_9PEZI|nr:hypothetical protein B0T23DRAFT_453156 [Neurospora hispaniola]